MNILILPLFRFPTGHSVVAETVQRKITKTNPATHIEIVDLLSYTNPLLEKIVGTTYIHWIQKNPQSYQFLYEKNVHSYKKNKKEKMPILTPLFIRSMKKLLEEKQPDLILCSHAFPSSILNALREKGTFVPPVVNVYTDFFMNNVWAKSTSDYHLVPHVEAKRLLIDEYGQPAERIFVTGVPIDDEIFIPKSLGEVGHQLLIAGGNVGFMDIEQVSRLLHMYESHHFNILCGNNKTLYENIQAADHPRLHAIPYLKNREQMNELYDRMDAVITKPGGVTMTELIHKRLPIYIDHFLPGPEQENFHYLQARGLVQQIDLTEGTALELEKQNATFHEACDRYEAQFEMNAIEALAHIIEQVQTVSV